MTAPEDAPDGRPLPLTPDHEDDPQPLGRGTIRQRLAALWQALWKSSHWGRPRRQTGSGEAALPIGFQAVQPVDAWLLWTAQVVWPALRRFARSHLSEISHLQRVARTLPAEAKPAWREAVRQVTRMRQTLRENPKVSAVHIFIRLVKLLNERWFIPRQILLACLPIESELRRSDNVADALHLIVCHIREQRKGTFQDADVPAYFVSMVFPPGAQSLRDESVKKNYFDPTSEWALIDLDFWQTNVLALLSFPDEAYQRHCLEMGLLPARLPLIVQEAAATCRLFPNTYRMFQTLVHRGWCEEVRHGIDCKRVLRGAPDAVVTGDYYSRVPEVLLPSGGRLWREVWEPVADGAAVGVDERQLQAVRTIQEVSGQLTAAAAGPVPQLLLFEWKQWIERALLELFQGRVPEDSKLPAPHETAARIAIALLAEQLQLAPPAPLHAAARTDYERLDSLVAVLLRRRGNELRLALKEIYRREFVYNQIDEPPFPAIGPKGEYLPRPAPDASAAVEAG